ncbi:MAG: PAS domain-containing protein [Candidatus Omnitrophica bacterium]|nr:PAS domain-containing protein [Candidatus Omnitrophota bacterium]
MQVKNDFFNNVIESLTYPFYVVDAKDYTIQIANAAACRGELLKDNLHCYTLTHKNDKPCGGDEHFCPLHEVKKTKRPAVVEHIHYDKEGNLKNVEVHGYPIFDSKGQVVQMIEYSLDITERRTAESELRASQQVLKSTLDNLAQAYERLRELDQMKSYFISIVSHELRTPLTAIKSAVSLLLKNLGKPKQKEEAENKDEELLNIILNNTNRQIRLVNDLLDLSKIESGVIRIEKKPIDIVELVRNVIKVLSFQLKSKNIECNIETNLAALFVLVDSDLIRRVFNNLIINAIKFVSDSGKIEIRIECKKEIDGVRIAVVDNGIGILAHDFTKLFDKFYQVGYQVNGVGLGLSIAKGIVEAHGGKIWVESLFKKSSSFYFTLPKYEEVGVEYGE